MNILYTIISFNTGGAEKLLTDIINNWSYEEDKLILCIINNHYEQSMINMIEKRDNIEIIYLNRERSSKNINFIYRYMSIIREKKIDIIHCQDKESLFLSLIGKFFNRKIKLFNTIHDTNTYVGLRNIYVLIDKYFVTRIIAISQSVKREIVARGISEDKVKVVYNGIDFEKYKIINCNQDKKIENSTFKIGCVARIQPKKKGQDILIKALEIVKLQYPNIKCIFAGTYMKEDTNDMKYLEKMVCDKKLQENVKFIGNVVDIPSFLSEIDIFVLPSRYEGFGISIIEAMASKTPVICSNIDGPKEILGDDKYGKLFEVENYNDLANKIIDLINNFQNINVERAYIYAKENYDIKSMQKKLRNIYLGNS